MEKMLPTFTAHGLPPKAFKHAVEEKAGVL
jgi:hypothetical protein